MLVIKIVGRMASFAAQAALRSRWSSLIESTSVDVPGEVSDGVRSVVGWLKQAGIYVFSVILFFLELEIFFFVRALIYFLL